ncbi:MAG TPA: periplasmic heavy metal sensor [Gemmatimonadales bacterium]|jgi:Spy/CpxP family protein refolding chaperone|nr:periplasmic heavy metal sensor [Gemmatimonadales bacterium]
MSPSRWRAAALLAAVFVLGLVVGAWGRGLAHSRPFAQADRPGPDGMVRRLSHELDLTPPQRDSVRAILDRHRPEMDSLWRDFRPRLRAVEQSVRNDIAAQLDTRQRDKFTAIVQRIDRRREARGRSGPDVRP